MFAFANTTLSVLRGTTVDSFGDELDNNTVAASGIPAQIVEIQTDATDESSSIERVIRRFVIKTRRNEVMLQGDRLGDERTGDIFLIDRTRRPHRAAFSSDLVVFAKYVDSVAMPTLPVGSTFNPFTGYKVVTVAGPVSSVTVTHNFGFPSHTSVWVAGELVLATITPLPNAIAPTSTLIEFDAPQSNITVLVSL